MSISTGRLLYSHVSLNDLIGKAYSVEHRQIEGPSWLESERFDIIARIPAGARSNQVPQMLQGLLRERFLLKLRRETRDMAVFTLVTAKSGPKLSKAESESGLGGSTSKMRVRLTGKASMAGLAADLSNRLGRAVFDRTGLTGVYAVNLDWAPDDSADNTARTGPSIFTALQEQLGLRLTAAKEPVEILIVESAAKSPTEN